MWALILEYQNYRGDHIEHYMPLFNSASECLWWIEHLWRMLQQNGAHDAVQSTCKFSPEASLN
jgi:hypothetical protein